MYKTGKGNAPSAEYGMCGKIALGSFSRDSASYHRNFDSKLTVML